MSSELPTIYRRLLDAYGPQHWWPANGAFEMMLGAILIQHTAWPNASRAIGNLREAHLIEPDALHATRTDRLARLIRPAGVYNVKAKRIKAFVRWYRAAGGFEALARRPTAALRRALLDVNGIGPETADDILVYAFHRPVFVVDAYARRVLARYGLIRGEESYAHVQRLVEQSVPEDPRLLGELHALVVEHAKRSCRVRPLCGECCLRKECAKRVTRDT